MMTSSEDEAAKLTQELQQQGGHIEIVLERVKTSVTWTPALAESAAGKALFGAIRSAPMSIAQKEAEDAYYTQLRDAEVKETMERWWTSPPVPADGEDLELTFIDVTPGDERWEPEKIPCSACEPFAHAAQRFRVVANKKHRHPFLPALYYTLVLDEVVSKSATFDSLSARTVADVLGEQNNERTLRYLRDHDGRTRSPARLFEPWDRARILPSWCTTPDTWIEPAPPLGFSASKVPGAQFYIAVPTIYVAGIGIVPSAIKPQLIARTLYWPVHDLGDRVADYPLEQEKDYVPPSQRLVPSALTTEAARALLGRYIQSSSEPAEPLRDDGPPSNKKRKKSSINKYAAQTVAIAWGLTLDDDGRPDWLHGVIPALQWQSDCVIDLKGRGRWFGRPNVLVMNCAWIGAVVLDADRRALQVAGTLNQDPEPEPEPAADGEPFEEWVKKTKRWIKRLNTAGFDKLVEVDQDGTFVAGDVAMSKADHDEWEASISGAKPGVWRMFVAPSVAVCFAWVREGTVDYDALPQFSGPGEVGEEEDGEWEELGSFSVDSGIAGLFSQSALDALIGDGSKEEKIETLMDTAIVDEVGEYVPGGIIVSGNDGGYVVEGIKDSAGRVVKSYSFLAQSSARMSRAPVNTHALLEYRLAGFTRIFA